MGSLQNVLCLKNLSKCNLQGNCFSNGQSKTSHFEMKQQGIRHGFASLLVYKHTSHPAYHDNTLLWEVWASQMERKLTFWTNCHMVNLFIFSIAQNKQTCVWDLQFHPAASTPYWDKDSWRLYSLPKSMLFDFRVLTKSNWLASENCFVRFSDILWRPNPSRWKARTGSTSGLKELGEEKEKHESTWALGKIVHPLVHGQIHFI